MSPMRDTALMLLESSVALAASVKLGPLDLDTTTRKGLAIQVNCPTAFTGTSPTLTITVRDSTSSAGDTTGDICASRVIAATAAAEYLIPFNSNKRTILVDVIAAGETTPSYGLVDVAVVQNVPDYTRLTEFR